MTIPLEHCNVRRTQESIRLRIGELEPLPPFDNDIECRVPVREEHNLRARKPCISSGDGIGTRYLSDFKKPAAKPVGPNEVPVKASKLAHVPHTLLSLPLN